jgi:uncharacterized damage-inducible protein DinB
MNWTELLESEIEDTYRAADSLMALVDESRLDWRPATGDNWMTVGQLLMHLTGACGSTCKGFVTGDWGLPAGTDPAEVHGEDMLPTAGQLPTVASVEEARRLLREDKAVALAMIAQSGEARLAGEATTAPWDPSEMVLGHRLLQMVQHLAQHKGQLFYYLKLQGSPVNTMHLWGV